MKMGSVDFGVGVLTLVICKIRIWHPRILAEWTKFSWGLGSALSLDWDYLKKRNYSYKVMLGFLIAYLTLYNSLPGRDKIIEYFFPNTVNMSPDFIKNLRFYIREERKKGLLKYFLITVHG